MSGFLKKFQSVPKLAERANRERAGICSGLRLAGSNLERVLPTAACS